MDVGIPEIDEDHKPVIILINEFNRSITEGKSPAEIKLKLQYILEETKRHFSQEEKLFDEWQYSDSAGHTKIHAHILKALQGIMEGFIPYGFDSSWIQTGVRIKKILLDHFINEDVKYAEFIKISPNRKSCPATYLNELE
jgi:hemerythrin-like metal-binding protein